MKLTFSNLPALGWDLPAERIVDLAGLCEEAGFDRFAVADIPNHFDCVPIMTACLLRTRRLEVESLVTNPYTRSPTAIASAWATMANLSGGRAIMGIGGGVESASQVWVAPWGYERPHPATAVREAVDVCRRLWRGEEVSLEGTVLHVSPAALKFACPDPIPVLIAARGKAMLRLAGEIADVAHLASLFLNVDHQRDNLARIDEGARRAGRPGGSFEIDLSLTVAISRDAEAARRAARRTAAQTILWMAGAERYSEKRTDWQRPPQLAVSQELIDALATRWDMWSDPALPDDLAAMISDDVLDQFAVAGGPRECAARLQAIAAALPEITGMRIKLPPPIGPDAYARYEETILLMGEVIDSLRAAQVPG
jgi:5,10-methylenetetrahydromethanopterin reductase